MTTTDSPIADSGPSERIEEIDVAAEMEASFLEYAYSVIYSRALPDARDGLKPVQRRIIYQMAEMGLRPDRGHVKSSRVVGEVMGKLHPHGDASIYDALVRLTQPFVLRVPLVDGHGNFGSLDDGPAAARYTEARLHATALALAENLDENVVDFVPNYDNQFMQPEVLSAAFPNLLVNGASGIAVGMATNMAPHNLIEVVAAARFLLDNPAASLEDLMAFVPGPDLPTGGTIVGLEGIRDAYASGRGAFKTRARVSIESITPRKTGLVVTELPYLVGTERIIEKIKDGVTSKKIAGISDVTDLTDRKHGMRLVIGIKTGFSPDAVLEQLYRLTPLEDGFSINSVALVDGGPRTLGLKELLQVYLDHRLSVVRRRTVFRLERRKERLHLVEGLLVAILDIDEVIQVIRRSDDSEQARTRLTDVFDLSQIQAEYILELRLRRLTRFSRIELESEADTLRSEIDYLQALLTEPGRIAQVVSEELESVAERFGTPRRTLLTQAAPSSGSSVGRKTGITLEVADAPCEVFLSTTGRAIRVDVTDGTEATVARRRTKHDAVNSRVSTTVRTDIGAVTNLGRLVRFSAVDLPNVPRSSIQLAAGAPLGQYLGLEVRERVVGLVSLTLDEPIAIGTREGIVKRVAGGSLPPRPSFEIISLREGDEIVGATHAADAADLVFVTSNAQLLRFAASTVRPQGVSAGGMVGIKLSAGAVVAFFGAATSADDHEVVTISTSSALIAGIDMGRVKLTRFDEFPQKGRATNGVRAHSFLKGEDTIGIAWVGMEPAVAVARDGGACTLPDGQSRRDASGVPLEALVGSVGSHI